MSKKALTIWKAVLAFVAAVALTAVIAPATLDIFNRKTVDQGARPLIAITTSGGDRGYALRVQSYVDADGDYRFIASFIADNVTYGEGGNTFMVHTQITLATPTTGARMHCGPGRQRVLPLTAAALDPGTRYLLEVDVISGRNSSTNFESDVRETEPPPASTSSPTASPEPVDAEDPDDILSRLNVLQYRESVWLLDASSEYSSGYANEGATFVVECTLNRALLWRSNDSKNPTAQPQATLLAPEFNFGSVTSTSDFQQDMTATLDVQRGAGMELVEAYPEPSIRSADWQFAYQTWPSGTLADDGYFRYSERITALFQNRDALQNEQNFLFIGGIAIGLLLTLFVGSVGDFMNVALLRDESMTPERLTEAQRMRRSKKSVHYIAQVLGVSPASVSRALKKAADEATRSSGTKK